MVPQSGRCEGGSADCYVAHDCASSLSMVLNTADIRSKQAIHHAYASISFIQTALIYTRTLLKVNAYYAFPALSTGEPIEPYTSTCLSGARAVVRLAGVAREIGFCASSTPLFIWSCWVAARVLFGMQQPPRIFQAHRKKYTHSSVTRCSPIMISILSSRL